MRKLGLMIIILLVINLITMCQTSGFNELIDDLENVKLPLKIDSFSNFAFNKSNQVELYNFITQQGIGYINHKKEYKKATRNYEDIVKTRTHEKHINGQYLEQQVKDSTKIGFIGLIKLSDKFTCILVKIEHVPNEFQTAYYYELLSYNGEGDHISTITIFELINDAITKDWIEEKPSPNVTSIIKNNGSIEIKWDEGYNEIYIQHVRLNNKGVFYVEKLEEKVVRD